MSGAPARIAPHQEPALGAHEVELEPRPYTEPPSQVTLLRMSKEQLLAMNEQELIEFAWTTLGLALDSSWSRTKMLEKLVSMAVQIAER